MTPRRWDDHPIRYTQGWSDARRAREQRQRREQFGLWTCIAGALLVLGVALALLWGTK
jgi:hypothetical protein